MESSHSSFTIVEITGVLVNSHAKFGDLTNIKGEGGNEDAISHILHNFKKLLKFRDYLENGSPKQTCDSKEFFKKLILFLVQIVEGNDDVPVVKSGNQLSTHNVPRISKFLMSELIVRLHLIDIFCEIVSDSESFNLDVVYKLFDEFLPCLDNIELNWKTKYLCSLLRVLARIAVNLNENKSHELEHLLRVTFKLSRGVTQVTTEQLNMTRKKTFYELVGLELNDLFDILLYCHEKNAPELFKNYLIEATTIVVQCVTLDVYCYWVEIDLESNQSLQMEVAEKAYELIQKYQNCENAKEILKMLQSFATKPKSLNERLWLASVDTKIFMVNKADENQKTWLKSLLSSSELFTNPKLVECLLKWSHLLDENDVWKIVDGSLESEDDNAKKIAAKCAEKLDVNKLVLVVLRHLSSNGFIVFSPNVTSELTTLFNNLQKDKNENLSKKFLMFLLLDPKYTMVFLLGKYLESSFYLDTTKHVLTTLKNVFKLRKFALSSLEEMMKTTQIVNDENFKNFVGVFQSFLDFGIVENDELITELFDPILEHFQREQKMEIILNLLRILNEINNVTISLRNSASFVGKLFEIIKQRTNLLEHNSFSQSLVQEVVKIFRHKINRNEYIDSDCAPILNIDSCDDKFIIYYKKMLLKSKCKLSSELGIEIENPKIHAALLTKLPACVTDEWIQLSSEIHRGKGIETLLKLLLDFMRLLCLNDETMRKSENYSHSLNGLIYCINQIGIVLQNVMSNGDNEDDESLISTFIIDLLSELPEQIKEKEGMNLVNLMTSRSLKKFKQNADMVSRICQIKNKLLCKVIAEKILA